MQIAPLIKGRSIGLYPDSFGSICFNIKNVKDFFIKQGFTLHSFNNENYGESIRQSRDFNSAVLFSSNEQTIYTVTSTFQGVPDRISLQNPPLLSIKYDSASGMVSKNSATLLIADAQIKKFNNFVGHLLDKLRYYLKKDANKYSNDIGYKRWSALSTQCREFQAAMTDPSKSITERYQSYLQLQQNIFNIIKRKDYTVGSGILNFMSRHRSLSSIVEDAAMQYMPKLLENMHLREMQNEPNATYAAGQRF